MLRSSIVAAGLVLALAGCGAASSTPAAAPAAVSPVATQSPAAVGLTLMQQAVAYSAVIVPLNRDLDAWGAKVTPRSTDKEVFDASAVLADQLDRAIKALASAGLTGQAAVDVRALIATFAAAAGDLRALSAQSAFTLGTLLTSMARDNAAFHAAAALVSADLSPPAP